MSERIITLIDSWLVIVVMGSVYFAAINLWAKRRLAA